MAKRTRSLSTSSPTASMRGAVAKKTRSDLKFLPNKIATVNDAAKADASPPMQQLLLALRNAPKKASKGECVVYWMRMEDLRIRDNRALSQASQQAQLEGVPLIALFVFSPQDYVAHDRSPRRIDFTLRNLKIIRAELAKLDIPLCTVTHSPRKEIPAFLHDLFRKWKATRVFANMEYEVDELRRDLALLQVANKEGKIACEFVHDKCVVAPGDVKTKDGRGYTVYSPFLRVWKPILDQAQDNHISEAEAPSSNDKSVRSHPTFSKLFDVEVPDSIEGFALDPEDKEKMSKYWHAGEEAAHQMLHQFLKSASHASKLGAVNPLEGEAKEVKDPGKQSRLGKYKDDRDRLDADSTSRMSPYLAAGVISARACIRDALKICGTKKVDASRDTGVGRWIQEIAWRDFYTHVLALFPRVSMGRPFQEKYANVQWETNEDHLQAWKEGRTGVPIVDASMRQAREMGWMHNRGRMIAAMYLTKDLMIDWRLGEKFFMETLIDGDLASNNGGWQWSASTGVDPAPYFRIFNPYTQSQKTDPRGLYIRAFVPELAKLSGADIHNPSSGVADKLGYPRPLVDHHEARQRALRRYKDIGSK
ncbi:DNA photolyase, FAD-binding/Cryptochrome [Epithele typhae]|uniref:DNA photolyase, FAD-binding/Cryptochrome n=1 Tax=Epithele typhae TaxID=378194 RepID=UPI0020076D12|nr:DNA photolyase, FAD-binding/Cryptochrome [Epithele typhae]KAH9943504.1 DNA photolyase, FAD-binding/Cryptochrome [Epithele typhae]